MLMSDSPALSLPHHLSDTLSCYFVLVLANKMTVGMYGRKLLGASLLAGDCKINHFTVNFTILQFCKTVQGFYCEITFPVAAALAERFQRPFHDRGVG